MGGASPTCVKLYLLWSLSSEHKCPVSLRSLSSEQGLVRLCNSCAPVRWCLCPPGGLLQHWSLRRWLQQWGRYSLRSALALWSTFQNTNPATEESRCQIHITSFLHTFDGVLPEKGHHHTRFFLRSAAFHSDACVFPSQKCTLDQDVEDPLIDFFLQELQKNK